MRGKRKKADVAAFEFNLEDNLFALHRFLKTNAWKHEPYVSFYVRDPKLRHIHKATVRDRVLYQAVFRVLYRIFDPLFIHDSYSCRHKKGTHRGVLRLRDFTRTASKNYCDTVYVLKCDVRKFFDSIDHEILFQLISRKIKDDDVLRLVRMIIASFEISAGKGLPLGNVTSQLFANIYLNELDQFMKHELKAHYYIRYCDDFVVVDTNKDRLERLIPKIRAFLECRLKLELHPNKVSMRKLSHGIDFLGYVVLPHYRVLRTKTKRRILKKIKELRREFDNRSIDKERFLRSLQSYAGMLTHCRGLRIGKCARDVALRSSKKDLESMDNPCGRAASAA